ncbi:MAG TPA: DNA primase [Planctomycetes bacterium]|nr:DNA primase [Planctomycetota bacterium]HIN80198.1 DNA primase [Planctomycetota bacterium]
MNFDEDRERVRAASPILDVVLEYGVDVKQKGSAFWALCPFHDEKTPSFKIDPERESYHCFGSCAEHGDVFSFVERIADTNFPGALRILADRSGIELKGSGYDPAASRRTRKQQERNLELLERSKKWFEAQLWSARGAPVREYLDGRGFSEKTLRRFGVGFAPAEWNALTERIAGERDGIDSALLLGLLRLSRDGSRHHDYFRNRVMFPIRGIQGKVVGFGGRDLGGDDASKYINSPDSSIFHKGQLLYGLEESRKEIRLSRQVMLMEGYTDVMMAAQVIEGLEEAERRKIPSPVATMGTSLTEENVGQLAKRANKVWLLFDGDTAGKNAAIKAAKLFLKFPSTEAFVVLLAGGGRSL